MVHAQQSDGVGGAGTVPFGRIGSADPGHEPGVRVGASTALDSCSSITYAFSYLETDTNDTVGVGLGTVTSLVHLPLAAITGSNGPVDARYDIDFYMADIAYRRLLVACNRHWMNYSVGFRYAHLNQEFSQNGNYGGGAGGQINTTTDIEFDGFGLHLGLDGERKIGSRGLSLYGKSSLNTMVGEFESNYRMFNNTGAIELGNAQWSDDRFAPILEYEFGLAWTSCSGKCRYSVGYLAMHWFNTVTTPTFVDAVQANQYSDVGDTISFDGLTTEVEYRW